MKKIILFLTTLFVCFGFSEKQIKDVSTLSNCCEPEVEVTDCIPLKKLAPSYKIYEQNKKIFVDNEMSLVLKIEAKKGINYMLRYQIQHRGFQIENTTKGLFLLNQKNDTLARTFLNGKNYEGFTYLAQENETLRVYIDPYENHLLNETNQNGECAYTRCIAYMIGTRKNEE